MYISHIYYPEQVSAWGGVPERGAALQERGRRRPAEQRDGSWHGSSAPNRVGNRARVRSCVAAVWAGEQERGSPR